MNQRPEKMETSAARKKNKTKERKTRTTLEADQERIQDNYRGVISIGVVTRVGVLNRIMAGSSEHICRKERGETNRTYIEGTSNRMQHIGPRWRRLPVFFFLRTQTDLDDCFSCKKERKKKTRGTNPFENHSHQGIIYQSIDSTVFHKCPSIPRCRNLNEEWKKGEKKAGLETFDLATNPSLMY